MRQVLGNKHSHPLSLSPETNTHIPCLSPRKQTLTSLVFLRGTMWNFVFDMSVTTRSQQSWMFKCFHCKSCYYPLEFPNLSTFAFKNLINMLVLVKTDILLHGKEGSELNRDFLCLCSFYSTSYPSSDIYSPCQCLCPECVLENSVCILLLLFP